VKAQVNAVPEVEGRVDSKAGDTVTAENTERIRQPLRFFPDTTLAISRNLGKGITIHLNELGQRQVTWTAKCIPKGGKQWVPRDTRDKQINNQKGG
jgi:hypothetical protein